MISNLIVIVVLGRKLLKQKGYLHFTKPENKFITSLPTNIEQSTNGYSRPMNQPKISSIQTAEILYEEVGQITPNIALENFTNSSCIQNEVPLYAEVNKPSKPPIAPKIAENSFIYSELDLPKVGKFKKPEKQTIYSTVY